MNIRNLHARWARRVAVCRSHVGFATDRERERLISLSTTALVMIAGLGSLGMGYLVVT